MNLNVKHFRQRIRREVVDKFDALDENTKLMYTAETCQMCGAHMTIRQSNRCLHDGAPPVCIKCYKRMQGDIDKLAPLFEQMGMF